MMVQLEENWFADGIIDFEYKKYLLLAYLGHVNKNFASSKLYPYLGELVMHYNNLNTFMRNKEATEAAFPKKMSRIDFEKFMISYESTIKNEKLMDEILKILDFSIPAIKKYLEEGREIYEWIEKQIYLRQLGIVPLQIQYGYMLIRNGGSADLKLYNYNLSIFENAEEKYRSISTKYVTTVTSHTWYNIQANIMSIENLLVPPPVYAIESEFQFPEPETLLPIARRLLVKYLLDKK